MQQSKPVIDLARHTLQLTSLALDELLLLSQLPLHKVHIARSHKLADLCERQVENTQMTDGIEGGELPRSVVAVPTCRIDVRRVQQAHLLVMAQRAHAQVKQACHFANAEQALSMFTWRVGHRTAPFGKKQGRGVRLALPRYATNLSKAPRRLSTVNATTQMTADKTDPHGEAMPMGNSVSE